MDISKAREILKEDGKRLTDEQMQEHINTAGLLSNIFFDMWRKMKPEEKKKWSKKQVKNL